MIKVKKITNIYKSTKMSTVNSIVILLSRLRATSTPSAQSVRQIYLSAVFSLILELCITLQVGISASLFFRIVINQCNRGNIVKKSD